jgi:hypothetical protein
LHLSSLKSVDKDFLKGTTINGSLFLSSLTSVDKDFLKKNISQLKRGFNKEKGYCFFDNILTKVLSVKETNGYIIYTVNNGFIAEKGDYTAHGVSVKKCIQDVEFKVMSEKLKKEPIKKDTIITSQYYRLITGACEQGMKQWKMQNNIVVDEITAKDLLPMLEKSNAYGVENFKKLISF